MTTMIMMSSPMNQALFLVLTSINALSSKQLEIGTIITPILQKNEVQREKKRKVKQLVQSLRDLTWLKQYSNPKSLTSDVYS